MIKSIFADLQQLKQIDSQNKYTKQDYYLSDEKLLKITPLSPLKNGFFFLVGLTAIIPGYVFLYEASIGLKAIGIIFFFLSFYCLFSRRELYIYDGIILRAAYIKIAGKVCILWKSELELNGFTSSEIFWTRLDGRTNTEAQAHLTIYSEKLGKTINIMHFLLNHDGQELLSKIILDIEKVIGLPITVHEREDYMGKY